MATATRWEAARRALTQAEASTGVRTRIRGATAAARPAVDLYPTAAGESAALDRAEPMQTVDPELLLPVPAALSGLFPEGGLRRGSTVQVSGGMSVLLALAAAAMAEESWCALVDLPDAGLAAAAGLGLALPRVVVVPRPGPDAPVVLATVADGFDVVVLGRGAGLAERDRRSLASRLRVRGAVLLTTQAWAGADVVLQVISRSWSGIGRGDGMLRTGELELSARHRRYPVPLTARVQLGPVGLAVSAAEPAVGTAPAGRPARVVPSIAVRRGELVHREVVA
ncbi:hypothetical protein [Ruania zhangjianzhongii]|uniref:hypothetical protein n=1 Tax=Ruania zhangjianzhongii TaxID=2603206 RepID=UPI0011C6F4B9|nr:hypothetical protein [Ruania zhangjianzhongii]